MKIPFSWLKEHVSFDKEAHEVAADLVRLGHEVEAIELPRQAVQGVRVGHILSMEAHPDADKLHLLTIDIAEAEPLGIVCGASNMGVGDKIPVATVGTSLPNGMKIKKGKIRGQVSLGMCCSEAELGLAEDADGLLILPKDAPIGAEVGAYLALEEAVLDIDITPNRGDCMSARGLARELAADYDLALIEPDDVPLEPAADVAAPCVRVVAQDDCPLYMARRIEGVVVKDAPAWMQARLVAAGQRSVNGVVDVLNYTMLDLGQPMHAFDADVLQGDIQVRTTQAGETFKALDGRELALHAEHVVIADDEQVLALAGIMGSEDSGVTEQTVNIVLESAAFRAALISTTRRTYGLVSEASMRFERGVDPAMIAVAMEQASRMIVSLFGGKAGALAVVGDADSLTQDKQIAVDMTRIESRLGMAVDAKFDDVLVRMGFGIQRDDDALQVTVPSHRHDVSLFEDMSEEYARVIGFDAIPAILPDLATIQPRKVDTSVRSAVALGFVQVINYAFVSDDDQRLFVADDGKDLRLSNPISEAMKVMRRSVWPSLLHTAKYNMNRQQSGVALVEHGRIYTAQDAANSQAGHEERNVMAWLMTGEWESPTWYRKARHADFFDLKGVLEAWLAQRGLTARFMADDTVQGLQAGQTAKIFVGKSVVGSIGKVDVDVAAGFDLNHDVLVASVDLDALPEAKCVKFAPLPEFPSVERDLVFLFDADVQADAVLQAVRKPAGSLLQSSLIFDRYDGQGVPEGKVSLGIRMVLQHPKRTLTQEDSDQVMQAVVDTMQTRFGAEFRA